jgi:hypothetical protein
MPSELPVAWFIGPAASQDRYGLVHSGSLTYELALLLHMRKQLGTHHFISGHI